MSSDPDPPVVHSSALVDPGAALGAGTRVWHFCHVESGAKIGRSCSFGQNCYVASGVTVGDRVRVQNNVSLYTGVEIEDDVFIGPSAVFTNVLNPRAQVSRKHEYRATKVRRGATIGANATVVCGVTLGEYCMIGAGAVVTRDVPDFALMVGVPARRIGWISRNGQRLRFESNRARCPATGEEYELRAAESVALLD